MTERIDNLQDQVNTLFATMNELCQQEQAEPLTAERSPYSRDVFRSWSVSQPGPQS